MGKGDKRTRRGKIFRGTFGKFRPKKSNRKETNQSPVQETPEPEPTEASE